MESWSDSSDDVVSNDVLVTGSFGGDGRLAGGEAGNGGGGTGSDERRRAGGSVRVGGAGPR